MFLLGILGLLVFYKTLGWVPANGRIALADVPDGPTGLLTVDGLLHGRFDIVADALHHLLLPAVVIALGPRGIEDVLDPGDRVGAQLGGVESSLDDRLG